jgi:serine/threonine protein kinase
VGEASVTALDTSKPVLQTISHYDLFEKIAEGGMGTVYKAIDKSSGQTVAIKVVPPQVAKNPVLMKRFEQEYAVANSLQHPNIVRALDFGTHSSSPYLVMEYVDGDTLGQRIERDGKIPETDAIKLIGQVAQALHKAHKQGLIHRDVKPDNVLVTSDGVAKLVDLGLVKELETDLNLTRTGRGLGTPHFMAPEQFRNAKNADARCDIYSLAATLYHMLTGELPFKSSGPLDAWMKKINNELVPARELVPGLSERVDWALRRAMSVDPEHRPATCREFVEDLTGRSTRKLAPSAEIPAQDTWYLVYTDDENVTRTVKGTLQGIRRSLKDGVLGDASNIRGARSKSGPFDALRNHPEFRDLVLTLERTPASGIEAPAPVKQPPKSVPKSQLTTGPASPPAPAPPPARPALPSVHPALSADVTLPPLIDLEPNGGTYGWMMWLILLVAAAGLAATGYFLLPVLIR